jgi:hypothetical protein
VLVSAENHFRELAKTPRGQRDALVVRPPQSVERGGTEARRKRALSSLPRRGGPLAERHVLRREGALAPPVSDPAPRFQTVVDRSVFPASTSSASSARD